MKSLSSFAASIIVITSVCNAATIQINDQVSSAGNYHGASGTFVSLKSSGGQVIPLGSRVRIGYILNYSTALDATLRAAASPADLAGSASTIKFMPLGEAGLPTGYGADASANLITKDLGNPVARRLVANVASVTYAGAADGSEANTTTTGGVARGTKLFLMVLNSNSMETATEWGLYSASSWTIPLSGTANTLTFLQDVDTSAEVYKGALGSLTLASITPVPEPATFSVLALGAMVALRRKRR